MAAVTICSDFGVQENKTCDSSFQVFVILSSITLLQSYKLHIYKVENDAIRQAASM